MRRDVPIRHRGPHQRRIVLFRGFLSLFRVPVDEQIPQQRTELSRGPGAALGRHSAAGLDAVLADALVVFFAVDVKDVSLDDVDLLPLLA